MADDLRNIGYGCYGAVLGLAFGACTLFPLGFMLGRMIENALGWSNVPLLGDPGISPVGGLIGFVFWGVGIAVGIAYGLRLFRNSATDTAIPDEDQP